VIKVRNFMSKQRGQEMNIAPRKKILGKRISVIAGNAFRRHFLLLPFPQSGPIRT